MKLTTRLGKPNLKIVDLLKKNHGLKGPISPWDNIIGSELYYGQSYDGEPQWKSFLENGSDIEMSDLKNQGAAALLFIPQNERYLIYIFGYGLGSLIEGKTEWDFGIKVVLNTIKPDAIRSLDSRSIGRKAKNKRVQLATQGSINEFDLDIMQELVSQIAGISGDDNFAKGLVGSESLMITVDMEGSSIAKKSNEIINRYKEMKYQANFNWIDFVAPIKDQSLIEKLDLELIEKLDMAISKNNSEGFVFSYPEIIDHFDVDHIIYHGFGSAWEYEYADMNDFITEYRNQGNYNLNHELDKLHINLIDGTDHYKKSYSLYRMISSEIEFEKNYYVFSNGIWFRLEKSYYNQVTNFFNALLINTSEFSDVENTYHGTETDYLKNFKSADSEVMDQVFFKGGQGNIEYADIVTERKEIIHVKTGGSSAKLSHLFNQGLVSARLMLNDVKFRKDFKSAIKAKTIKSSYETSKFLASEVTIVFRIIKSGSKFKLPFFSKITLYDTYQKITSMGYKFRLDRVKY